MPQGDKRADYGYGAPLPPELDPRRGRRSAGRTGKLSVSELQTRNSDVSGRGRHRANRSPPPPPPATWVQPSPPRRSDRHAARRHGSEGNEPTWGGTGTSWPPAGPCRAQLAGGGTFRRGALLGSRIVIALLSIAALIGSGVAWATYRQFTQGIQHGLALPKVAKGKKDIDGKDQNILLLGNDSIAGATPAEVAALGTTADRNDSATDTMMILHVPADGSRATIISFPRDSWVAIPGHGEAKINAAYVDGFNDAESQGKHDLLTKQSAGIYLAAQTLTQLTGLHIDHYVQVNLLGFYEISEAIGGVDLCLNKAQNASTEGDPSHPNGYSGINLKQGWNRNVKGKQALAFVRQRHGLPRGDIDRIARQQYFLSAVFHKAVSGGTLLNVFKLRSLLNAVKKSLITDPSLNILQFIQQFSKIAGGNLTFGTPPWSFGTVDGSDVVLVNPAAVKDYVDKLVGAPVDKKLATARTIAPTQVSVTVLNQSNQDHVATNNAAVLGQAGFLATVGNTDQHTDQTVIDYPNGMQSQAKTLAKYVPNAQLVQSSTVSTVTLVLGSDGVSARAKPATPTKKTAKPKPSPHPSGVTDAAQNSKSCIN
jgi:LCP family protein required for cell wall assembly